jgi:HNH endonuclease
MNKGDGMTIQFIRQHELYAHKDWCLIWPFSKSRGYGTFRYLGKTYYAHRFMCELAHGHAPSDIHEAAHSCGDAGCVNPNHLSWKTPSANGLDCRKHGTHVRSRLGSGGKITPEQAETIRSLKGVKKLWELADEYGVSESTISNIWVGRTHYRPRIINHWKPEEDATIKYGTKLGLSCAQIAEQLSGRSASSVASRAKRIKARLARSESPAVRTTGET